MIERLRSAAPKQLARQLLKGKNAPADDPAGDPDDAVTARHQAFDATMSERAELLREAGVLRDMMLAQLKADDEALKKFIAMI